MNQKYTLVSLVPITGEIIDPDKYDERGCLVVEIGTRTTPKYIPVYLAEVRGECAEYRALYYGDIHDIVNENNIFNPLSRFGWMNKGKFSPLIVPSAEHELRS